MWIGTRRPLVPAVCLSQSQRLSSATREDAMKQYFGLGVGLLTGTFIGAAAVSGLHAQGKAPVYLVTEIDVTNPDAYGKEFAPKAQATIKAAGGKFVVIGGAGGVNAKPITAIEGTPPKR